MNRRHVLILVTPAYQPRLAGIARYARQHGWQLTILDRIARQPKGWKGEYRLDKDDVIEGLVPSDSVFLCSNSIDLHAGGNDKSSTVYMTIRDGDWYGVPYRCLVPQKVDGLLVAGRCVSASSVAAAAIRVMPPCMAMGQAVGTAAAMAVKSGLPPRRIDAEKLVTALKADGVWLG